MTVPNQIPSCTTMTQHELPPWLDFRAQCTKRQLHSKWQHPPPPQRGDVSGDPVKKEKKSAVALYFDTLSCFVKGIYSKGF